uniref:Cytokinin-O-glucosyltransferase 2 n=1 Tax=Aegilops tauschii TaxID=37682 RepID=M8BN37_AEGTA
MEMGSLAPGDRPHAVMIPYPAQGHVTPMLKLAKLLHAKGFHVTFVNNEFNHRRLLRSQSADTLRGLPGFRFAAIADGLPPSDREATQDIPALCYSTMTTCLPRFKELIVKLNEEAEASGGALPPVTCVVADSVMSFGLRAARELGLRCATLWTASACGYMGYCHYKDLLDRGLFPLKEEAQLSNGYLDTTIDWIPAMPKDIRLRDLPTFLRAMDPDDIMFNFFVHETAAMSQASAVVINTWDELDSPLLDAMSKLLPPIYTVGPLHLTEKVLEHEAVGVFLTHSGWNSSLEGICGAVPMVCWPFFAEQQTNCRYKCTEWGIGMEIGDNVRRTEVEAMIREVMEEEKGREMRRRVIELQKSAVASARPGGRSMHNVDRLIQEVLLA